MDVRVPSGDVRVLVMANVVTVAPRFFVDGGVPGEGPRTGTLRRLSLIVGTVQNGVRVYFQLPRAADAARERPPRLRT